MTATKPDDSPQPISDRTKYFFQRHNVALPASDPSLSDVADALRWMTNDLEQRIEGALRVSGAVDETMVWTIAALDRARRLVEAVQPIEPAVSAFIVAERKRSAEDAERKKEKARYWAERRQAERAAAPATQP